MKNKSGVNSESVMRSVHHVSNRYCDTRLRGTVLFCIPHIVTGDINGNRADIGYRILTSSCVASQKQRPCQDVLYEPHTFDIEQFQFLTPLNVHIIDNVLHLLSDTTAIVVSVPFVHNVPLSLMFRIINVTPLDDPAAGHEGRYSANDFPSDQKRRLHNSDCETVSHFPQHYDFRRSSPVHGPNCKLLCR